MNARTRFDTGPKRSTRTVEMVYHGKGVQDTLKNLGSSGVAEVKCPRRRGQEIIDHRSPGITRHHHPLLVVDPFMKYGPQPIHFTLAQIGPRLALITRPFIKFYWSRRRRQCQGALVDLTFSLFQDIIRVFMWALLLRMCPRTTISVPITPNLRLGGRIPAGSSRVCSLLTLIPACNYFRGMRRACVRQSCQ